MSSLSRQEISASLLLLPPPPPRRLQRTQLLVLGVFFVMMSYCALGQYRILRLVNKSQFHVKRMELYLVYKKAGEDPPFAKKAGKSERTVGVVVTLTGCDGFPPDGAAVLQHSIARQSSRYRYSFYVVHHPSAKDCAGPLADLNFTLVERESPVLPQDIQGRELRDSIAMSGCCGERELLKLEAFTLTQHDAVIWFDIDAVVIKALDDAIDLLLDRKIPANATSHLMYPERPLPKELLILHTGDYHQVLPDTKFKPAQGGFAILKPNRTVYNEIMGIVRARHWSRKLGWIAPSDGRTGNRSSPQHTGRFFGYETVQGLVPYYFHILNDRGLDLNWCQYNNIHIAPRHRGLNRCHTNQNQCEDCRDRNPEELSSFHFIDICKKPWQCWNWRWDESSTSDSNNTNNTNVAPPRLCREMHRVWFEYRSELEVLWGRSGHGSFANHTHPNLRGYCSQYGRPGYEPIHQPYGAPL